MVELRDTLTLDSKARRLSTGELVATVRCARTGVQDYAGAEVGKPELDRVTVFRPEAEVMKRDSLASFAGVPVTIDHPGEAVTTDNWKQFAVGETGDDVLRDGQFIRVPMMVRDEAAIRAIQDGKRQISMGYSCSLEFVDGVTDAGEPYQAIQRNLKINHLAVVDNARGGPSLTVSDERTYSGTPDSNKTASTNSGGSPVATKTITFDGLPVETTDAAEAVINKLQGQITAITADKAKAEGDLAKLTTDKSTLEAKVTTLEQQVKDAKLTPQQLRDAAKAFAHTLDMAKKLAPTVSVNDVMDEADIRKAVVSAKLGDASKNWTDEQVSISFDTLAAQVKDSNIDPIRNVMSGAAPQNIGDAKAEYQAARDLARKNLSDGWKTPAANAA